MDISITDSKGDIIESFHLSIKTTPQCLSKFKYLYKDQDQNIKVYNPREYTGYYLYAHNLDDSIFYLVHPNFKTQPDNTTFKLTIGDDTGILTAPTHSIFDNSFLTGFVISAFEHTYESSGTLLKPIYENQKWSFKENTDDQEISANIPLNTYFNKKPNYQPGGEDFPNSNINSKCIPDSLIDNLNSTDHKGIDIIRLPIGLQWLTKISLDDFAKHNINIENNSPITINTINEVVTTLQTVLSETFTGMRNEGACISLKNATSNPSTDKCVYTDDGKSIAPEAYCARASAANSELYGLPGRYAPDTTLYQTTCLSINNIQNVLGPSAEEKFTVNTNSPYNVYPKIQSLSECDSNIATACPFAGEHYLDSLGPSAEPWAWNNKIPLNYNNTVKIDDNKTYYGSLWLESDLSTQIPNNICKATRISDTKYDPTSEFIRGSYMHAVQQFIKNGKKVIVTLQSNFTKLCGITGGAYPLTPSQFYAIWYMIAVTMILYNRDYHHNIIFELFDKPQDIDNGCKLSDVSKNPKFSRYDPKYKTSDEDYYNTYYNKWGIMAIRQAEQDLSTKLNISLIIHDIFVTPYGNNTVSTWTNHLNTLIKNLNIPFPNKNFKNDSHILIAGTQYCDKSYKGIKEGCDPSGFQTKNQIQWLTNTDNELSGNPYNWFMTEGNIICNPTFAEGDGPYCAGTCPPNEDLWNSWLHNLYNSSTNKGFTLWNVNIFASPDSSENRGLIGINPTKPTTDNTKNSWIIYNGGADIHGMNNLKYGKTAPGSNTFDLSQFKSNEQNISCNQKCSSGNNLRVRLVPECSGLGEVSCNNAYEINPTNEQAYCCKYSNINRCQGQDRGLYPAQDYCIAPSNTAPTPPPAPSTPTPPPDGYCYDATSKQCVQKCSGTSTYCTPSKLNCIEGGQQDPPKYQCESEFGTCY